MSKILLAVAASLTVVIAAVSVIALHGFLRRPFPALADVFLQRTDIFAAMLGGLSLLAWLTPWRTWSDYGLRLPVGFDWLLALPAAAICSIAGGAWFPSAFKPGPSLWSNGNAGEVAVILSFAVSAELLFRGLALGVLGRAYSTQKPGGHWFLSWPVIFSSLLYAFWALFPFRGITAPGALESGLGALAVGICCGMARERSGSMAAPILIHCLCLFVPVLV